MKINIMQCELVLNTNIIGLGLVAISDPEATKLIYGSYKFEKEYRYEFCIENVQNIFSTW
jgi:hypothetical protein